MAHLEKWILVSSFTLPLTASYLPCDVAFQMLVPFPAYLRFELVAIIGVCRIWGGFQLCFGLRLDLAWSWVRLGGLRTPSCKCHVSLDYVLAIGLALGLEVVVCKTKTMWFLIWNMRGRPLFCQKKFKAGISYWTLIASNSRRFTQGNCEVGRPYRLYRSRFREPSRTFPILFLAVLGTF